MMASFFTMRAVKDHVTVTILDVLSISTLAE